MAIKVDNLNNIFWDNGAYRLPNTHPHLINGEWLENVTPVMTTPVTGWVILTGEFNYCEYKGELFFLKKDALISESKNKWRYILIKDHVCSLFKNKANVLATGTLINGSLDKLQDEDFQFTIPVFTNYNKRILLPLNSQLYNWKKHIIGNPPTKNFDSLYAIDNEAYSIFLRELENNKEQLKNVKFEKARDFTLLGRAKLSKKKQNWKNELVNKIKQLLADLDNEDIVLSKFPPEFGNSPFLRNKYVITYKTSSIGAHIEEHKQVLNLDLSGLQDIELVTLTSGEKSETAYFRVPLKEVQVQESRDFTVETYIKKLTRRNRVSFLNAYSTRAIYEKGQKLHTFFYNKNNGSLFFPQKIYFKIKPSLLAKTEWSRRFPVKRKLESFRSVYLYYCRNLNFTFKYTTGADFKSYEYSESNFIEPDTYLKDNSNKSLAKNTLVGTVKNGIAPVDITQAQYEESYPWKTIGEALNIGWLIGQFSEWINNQGSYFEAEIPIIVKKPFSRLKRIKGLNKVVSRLVQNEDAYEPTSIREEKNYHFTLDLFCKLSARARQATDEADFLIGEKLLFTSWGLGAYLLFQPLGVDGYSYTVSTIDKDNALFSRWLEGASWYYGYSVFDSGNYVSQWAKQWIKKGYDSFKSIDYKRFYENPQKFAELKEHIKKNTEAYFINEEVDFTNSPIGEVKAGDIFFSDLEYYFYDASEGTTLAQSNTDWFKHDKDSSAELENGEIVVYHDIKEGGIAIGKVNVWETETNLPEDQFISEGSQISSSSSNVNKVRTKLTKIRKLSSQSYSSFDEVLNALRNSSYLFLSDVTNFTLEELSKTGVYLFDLKGTDFLCYLDNKARVHLIFKEGARDVQTSNKKVYAIAGNEVIANLDKTQWVNQKINLSIYGQKIELPVKAFAKKILVTIELDTATLNKEGNLLDSHKVEVTHPLGKTYLRFDTPKLGVVSTGLFNAYDIERLDIENSRAGKDYFLKRREFEMGMENMDLEHRKIKFENEIQKRNNTTNLIMNSIGAPLAIGGGIYGLASKAVSVAGLGPLAAIGFASMAAKSIKGIVGAIQAQSDAEQKFKMIEEKMALSIQQQALNSYTLDLTHNRQKEDYIFNLRKQFNQESFSQTSSRERNQALDDKEADLQALSRKEDKEIYLELWTISDKQKEYVDEYHKEYGVDCRVINTVIPFGNGMKTGVYKMESVEILNLNDRVDTLLIKSLLENGIQIVEWIEHEKVRELIPEDPRIAKLQSLIKEKEDLIRELQQRIETHDNRIAELTVQVGELRDEEHRLTEEVANKNKEIEQKQEQINVAEQNLKTEQGKYADLSKSYRTLEEAKATEERLKKLYLDEKNKLAGEKKKLETAKKELIKDKESLQSSLATVTENRDSLILQVEEVKREKTVVEKELKDEQIKTSSLEREAVDLKALQTWVAEKGDKQNIEQAFEKVREFDTRIMQGDDRWNDKSIAGWRLRIADFLWKEDYYKAIEQVLGCENFTSKDKAVECITRHKEGCQAKEALENELRELKAKPSGNCFEKPVDYVISKDSSNNIVILAWNSQYGIYRQQKHLVVKKNKLNLMYRIAKSNDAEDKAINTDNYPFLGRFVQSTFDNFKEKVTNFEELKNDLEGKRDGATTAKPQTAYAWLGRISVELDNNIPYINTDEINDDTELAKEFYYDTIKGWFDYQIEGSKKVSTYREYKEIFKDEVKELRKLLTEKEDTIKALRELEARPKETKELNEVDLMFLVGNIFHYFARVKIQTTLWNYDKLFVITKNNQNGLIYLKFLKTSIYWVKTKLKIWAYDGYKAFAVSTRTDNKLERTDNFSRAYWQTLNSGYFTRIVDYWAGQGAKALQDWVYVGNEAVEIIEDFLWPYFETKPNSDEDLVANVKPLFYLSTHRAYTYDTTDIPVKNAGDYKRTLRMMFSPN